MTLNNIMQAIIARKRKRGAIRIPVAPRGVTAPDKPGGPRCPGAGRGGHPPRTSDG